MVDGSKVFGGSGGKDIGKLIGLRQARLKMGTVSRENRGLSGVKSKQKFSRKIVSHSWSIPILIYQRYPSPYHYALLTGLKYTMYMRYRVKLEEYAIAVEFA